MLTFKTNTLGEPVTDSGRPVVCDGCGVKLTSQPGPDQQQEVPPAIARLVYGNDAAQLPAGAVPLTYIVCERGIDCLTLALLADDLYRRTACKDPLCTGDGTLEHPCRSPLGRLS